MRVLSAYQRMRSSAQLKYRRSDINTTFSTCRRTAVTCYKRSSTRQAVGACRTRANDTGARYVRIKALRLTVSSLPSLTASRILDTSLRSVLGPWRKRLRAGGGGGNNGRRLGAAEANGRSGVVNSSTEALCDWRMRHGESVQPSYTSKSQHAAQQPNSCVPEVHLKQSAKR